LAELIENAGDTVFQITFRKQPTAEHAQEKLQQIKFDDLKKKDVLSSLSKEISEGQRVTMICHLVEAHNNLGRSTVIDLSSDAPSKFRQVDHRSIEAIVLKNVKYTLKKGSKAKKENEDDEEEKKEAKGAPKWDKRKLEVSNWFSGTKYYVVNEIKKDAVLCSCEGEQIEIDKSIVVEEMHNASVYDKEEKLALTKVVKIFKDARSTVFTVCFTCKIDEK